MRVCLRGEGELPVNKLTDGSEIFLEVMFHHSVAEPVCGDADIVEVKEAEKFGKDEEAGGKDFSAFLLHAWNLDSFFNTHP